MPEYLVISLSAADAQQASWVVVDGSTMRTSSPEHGALADARAHAGQRPAIVLVPGEAVVISPVNLPVRGLARMQQAAPFALEEHLADDVRDLHFAVGRRDADARVPVAVVRRDIMGRWVEALESAGITPLAMYPDTLCVPPHKGFTIVIDGGRALIRQPDGQAMAGEADMVGALVQAMGAAPEEPVAGSHLYLSPGDAATLTQPVTELRMTLPELVVLETANGALPLLASTAVGIAGGPNLLQGDYAVAGEAEKYWSAWRTAAMLGGLVLLTALGVKATEVMTLKAELRTLNQQLNEVAAAALPPGSRIIEPVTQLEQRVTVMRSNGGNDDHAFLEMLQHLGTALSSAGTTIGKLDYRNGTMDLTLDAPDVDTLDRIRAAVESSGTMQAVIQSANQREARVQGRMRITRRNS